MKTCTCCIKHTTVQHLIASQNAWGKYATGREGKKDELSLQETVEILNGWELQATETHMFTV
jgi:hypothetical protein